MKHTGKIAGLFGLGLLLVAFNLGGVAGCGDSNGSSGGGGGGGSNNDATAAALTSVFGSLSSFANPSDTPTLIANTEQAGLKAATSTCTGDPSTSITCDCEGGGSFTFSFGSSSDNLNFANCVDVDGATLNGDATIEATSTGFTMTLVDLEATLVGCGSYTLNGTEDIVDNGDGSSAITIDLTAAQSGGSTVNIDGNLTANSDDTISGDLDYTGGLSLSCTFNHDDLENCENFANGCGVTVSDICEDVDGDGVLDDYRTDVCE